VPAVSAVAVKNLESAFTVWGVPAKKISNRNSQLSNEFDGTHGVFW
jgi:serine acetyltransferase